MEARCQGQSGNNTSSTFTTLKFCQKKCCHSNAYDNNWDTPYILKKNREIVKSIGKITNPIPNEERKRELRLWSMTIEDIYLGGEQNAIANIIKWKDYIRKELRK